MDWHERQLARIKAREAEQLRVEQLCPDPLAEKARPRIAYIRYRCCPDCDATMPAGQLRYVDRLGKSNWKPEGAALRQCPHCGYIGQTHSFPIATDRSDNLSTEAPHG